MINQLFVPETKVQNQRAILKETDARVAKYSRRGVVFSVLAFFITMSVGRFYGMKPEMTYVLGTGLLLFSLVRAYYCFRFESIYAHGPAQWRNKFFLVSLIGVAWWSFILCNVTITVGFVYETPLLWIYSSVFFASIAYVLAPYRKFLTLYLFIGIIPPALTAMTIYTPLSSLNGLLFIILFLMLHHQGVVVGQQYWDRLQANYDLKKRASALEAERIDNESSIATNQAFLDTLSQEMRVSFDDVLGTLSLLEQSSLTKNQQRLISLCYRQTQRQSAMVSNVIEFSHMTEQAIDLDHTVTNPRVKIEQTLVSLANVAHRRGIEVYSAFAPELPIRIRCDENRFSQVVHNLVTSAFEFCEKGELFVRCHYIFLDDKRGKMRLEVVNVNPTDHNEDLLKHAFDPYQSGDIDFSLNLSIAKSIAEMMGGTVEIEKTSTTGLRFLMTAVVDTVAKNSLDNQHVPKLTGKRVLLYQPPTKIVSTFIQTLNNWGLEVDTVNESERAIARLSSANSSKSFDLVIIYTALDNTDSISFADKLAGDPTLCHTPRMLVISRLQEMHEPITRHTQRFPNTQIIFKPIRQKNVLQTIKSLLIESDSKVDNDTKKLKASIEGKSVLLFQKEEIEMVVADGLLSTLGCHVVKAKSMEKAIEYSQKIAFDVFITESHFSDDIKPILSQIRENQSTLTETPLVILALSGKIQAQETTFCLSCGMDGFIDKPLNLNDLEITLRRWVGQSVNKESLEESTQALRHL